ncbi:MAG TPA: nuclear transport factor 2 family protein [Cyclobacteriaceae bacterium]|nr:nuclear transport factor 2 family protein [Cyclobacteriaceae bacterium]
METREIAQKLVDYCRKSDWHGAHKELYAQNAKSIEPYETPNFAKEISGLKAIEEKGKKFDGMVEKMHTIEVSDPLVAGNTIAFKMEMDATMKDGQRMNMPELCVYHVKDGKIISEEFFV